MDSGAGIRIVCWLLACVVNVHTIYMCTEVAYIKFGISRSHSIVTLGQPVLALTLLLLLLCSPAVSLGFTILGEIFAYVALFVCFLIQPLG